MSEAATATHYVRPDSVLRYTFLERVMHWVTALAYTYCLATGLAFYTPYLFWIAVILGGGPTSRFWHPIVGLGFVAAAVWMHSKRWLAWKPGIVSSRCWCATHHASHSARRAVSSSPISTM